jgi:hypothetical protein
LGRLFAFHYIDFARTQTGFICNLPRELPTVQLAQPAQKWCNGRVKRLLHRCMEVISISGDTFAFYQTGTAKEELALT